MDTSAAKWYVISIHSGFENSVVSVIKERAAKKGLLEQFEDFLIPSEQIVEVRKGTKTTVDKKCFPGYILVKAYMSDEVWSFICSIPRVNGFLGAKKPLPVSEAEINRIVEQVKESHEKPRSVITFEIGEMIKVADGPFTSFTGRIEDIDSERERLTVSVTIFGRPTPIELEMDQVEKA